MREAAQDEYEDLLKQETGVSGRVSAQSARTLMDLHSRGISVFPRALTDTMETLQPTSVAAERAFSKARKARRYDQGSLDDERFGNYLFLKDYYTKTGPWDDYMAENSKTKTHGIRRDEVDP